MEPYIGIILVNYNGLNDTIECMESIEKINYNNYSVIIIDNACEDNEYIILKNMYKKKNDVKILRADNNGFASANNLGMKYFMDKEYEYVLLLNNDTVVDSELLKELLEPFYKDVEIGISTGLIRFYDHELGDVWFDGGSFNKCLCRSKHESNKLDYLSDV